MVDSSTFLLPQPVRIGSVVRSFAARFITLLPHAPLKGPIRADQSVCRGDVSVQKWTNAVATASRSLRSCSANQPRLIKLLIAAGESTISTITAPCRRRSRQRRCRLATCEIFRDKVGRA